VIVLRRALVVGTVRRVSPDDQEVIAGFETLMSRAGRKNRYVSRFQAYNVSLRSSELHLSTAAGDAKNFVDA